MMILFNLNIIFNWRFNEFLYATVVDDYAGMKFLALGNLYFLTLKLLLMGMNADPSPIYNYTLFRLIVSLTSGRGR